MGLKDPLFQCDSLTVVPCELRGCLHLCGMNIESMPLYLPRQMSTELEQGIGRVEVEVILPLNNWFLAKFQTNLHADMSTRVAEGRLGKWGNMIARIAVPGCLRGMVEECFPIPHLHYNLRVPWLRCTISRLLYTVA